MVEVLSTAQPYPGLRPFDHHDAEYFFGREAHISALYRKLLLRRFVAVVGASGSGKSSLVRAGLQPLLASKHDPGWRVYVLRPESAPFRRLVDELLPANTHKPDTELRRSRLLALLERDSDGLNQAVAELKLQQGARFLLVIDQFEELIRYDQTNVDTSLRFIRLLLRSATQRQLPIHIMITMRLDFLGDCARYTGLTELINEGQYLVPALDRLQRRDAIEKPARLGGKSIHPELVQTLLNDADDAHDQLPVLQHALMRLWQAAERQQSDNITLRDYATIGTLKSALSKHANEVFDDLAADLKPYAEGLFKAITDLDKQGRGIRRPQRAIDIAKVLGLMADTDLQDTVPPTLLEVIDPFRAEPACFLLPPAGENIKPNSTIDISHESLIRVWDKFNGDRDESGWLEQEAQDGKIYSGLVDGAREFIDNYTAVLPPKTAADRLQWWRLRQPNQYWAKRYVNKPSGLEYKQVKCLLSASKRNLTWQRTKQRAQWLGAGLTILLIAGSIGFIASERTLRKAAEAAQHDAEQALKAADKARAEAEQALADKLTAEQAQRQAELEQQKTAAENDLKRVRLLANQALELARNGEGETSLALAKEILVNQNDTFPYVSESEQAAYAAIRAPVLSLNQEGGLYGAVLNTDDSRILYWGWSNALQLWDAERGKLLQTLLHESKVYGAVFSADGTRILSWSADSTVRLWDASSGDELLMLRHDNAVYGAAFSADGSRILSWSADNTARLWDSDSGKVLLTLLHNSYVMGTTLSADGTHILSWSENNVWLWDAFLGTQLLKLSHEAFVIGATVSANGTRILSWENNPSSPNDSNTLWLWDATTGKQLFALIHENQVMGATFNADGNRVLSWSRDNTARLWDADSGELLFTLLHEKEVMGAAFNADETRILSWSENNAWLWDAVTGAPLITLRHESPVLRAMFNAYASRILSRGSNGLWLWSTQPLSRYPKVLAGSVERSDINSKSMPSAFYGKAYLQFSASGKSIARVLQTGLSQWGMPDGEPLLQRSIESVPLAFCNTDDTLLSIATDGYIHFDNAGQTERIAYDNAVNPVAAALTPDCRAVAILLENARLILLRKNPDWRITQRWQINRNSVSPGVRIAIDYKNQRIIGATESGDVFIAAAGSENRELELKQGQSGSPVALHAERSLVASEQSTRGGTRIVVWSIDSGETLLEAMLPAKSSSVLDAAFSPDGQRLLVLPQGEPLQLWNVPQSNQSTASEPQNTAPIGVFGQANENFIAVTYGPDNQQIAALNNDGSVKIWPIFKTTQDLAAFIRDEINPAPLNDEQRCQYGLLDVKECAAAK